MFFNNLTIGKKLGLSFTLIILFLMALATLSYTRVRYLAENIDLANADRYPKTVLAHTVKDELNETARYMRNILLMSDAEQIKKELINIDDSTTTITAALNKLDQSIKSARGRADLQAVTEARSQFVPLRDKFLQMIKEGKSAEARSLLLTDLRPVQLNYMKTLDTLIQTQGKLMEDTSEESEAVARQTQWLIMLLAGMSIVMSGLIARAVTKRIVDPLEHAVKIARRVADGDLTSHIEVVSGDETGKLMLALRDMNESLNKIVNQVRIGTQSISSASGQIASGNMDLSSRTEQQASSLEQTAASMEQLASTVRQNAENASQANELARSSSEIAVQGGDVVSHVVDTMDQINTSARKIVDIISVIDGIAFQTNILALNAAVEAARAGEQGRGFAVVASEVRNLAQRSAAAAKEIKQLIDHSVETTEAGTAQVAHAGKTMSDVVTSVKRVSDIIGEIAAASREQSSGIEQINEAVTQMDEVTQQNAALVEEAAAAARQLQDEANALVDMVSIFKTIGGDVPVARRTPRSPSAMAAPLAQLKSAPVSKSVIAKADTKTPALSQASSPDWEAF